MESSRMTELRSRYGGRISAAVRGDAARDEARVARALMSEWNPILSSEQELRSLMGEPTLALPGILEYVFDNDFGGQRWRFGIRNDLVISVEWDGLD